MKHPYEKYYFAELILIGLSYGFFLIALLTSFKMLVYLGLFSLATSMFLEGFIHHLNYERRQAIKAFLKAFALMLLIISIVFIR